jgi:hypothetical protein
LLIVLNKWVLYYETVFVVDLNAVDQKSIYADDNGVWNTACPRSNYKVDIRDGKVENVVPGNKSDHTHFLKRQYGTHQATYNAVLEEVFVDDLILYICCKFLGSDEADVVCKEPPTSSTSFLYSRRGFVSCASCFILSNTHGSVLKKLMTWVVLYIPHRPRQNREIYSRYTILDHQQKLLPKLTR